MGGGIGRRGGRGREAGDERGGRRMSRRRRKEGQNSLSLIKIKCNWTLDPLI